MHKLADKPEKGKPKTALAEVLLAQADALELQAQTLRATAKALDAAPPDSGPLLGTVELKRDFHVTREVLRAAVDRGELEVFRGAKGRIQVRRSEIERWIESRKWTPKAPKRTTAAAADLDAWESQAEAELKLVQGGRR